MTATQRFRVDDLIISLAVKSPCVVQTVANITLSGEQTINTIAVVVDDRVLVKDQTDKSENGLWQVQSSAWVRPGDWDGPRDATNGTLVIVVGIPDQLYQCSTAADPFVIDTSDCDFLAFANATLASDLASTSSGLGASLVSIEDVQTLLVATDVEAALEEIAGGTSAKLLVEFGSFTANWLGFTTSETSNVKYTKLGNQVTMFIEGTPPLFTSNTTALSWTTNDIPASIRPASPQRFYQVVQDSGVNDMGSAVIDGSVINFLPSALVSSGFTASGTKGLPFVQVAYTYKLD